jgi:hypothetical protein
MNKRYWSALVLVLVVIDGGFTFWQNYQFPLDGDLVPTVFPAPWYSHILHDPFGWAVLTKNAMYAGTNRFFAHAAMSVYWKRFPHLLQTVFAPIDSLYIASALFNTVIQTAILLGLAAYVRLGGRGKGGAWPYWLAVALLLPLFQTDGFYEQMGITNRAITYTFFYAFPIAMLLALFWPFFKAAQQGTPFRIPLWRATLLVLLMVVIAFNGPIAIAAIAVLLLGIAIYWAWQKWRVRHTHALFPLALSSNWLSGQAMVLLGILAATSLYSLYIGRNNAENSHTHTLWELYQLLPTGIYLELKLQWGLPLLLGLIMVNAQLLRHATPVSSERQQILKQLRWVGLFALVFALLLPFGGYRDYRPYLVRSDSILPILVGLLYAYGISTYYLLHHLTRKIRLAYIPLLLAFTGTFVYADTTTKMPYNNDCERWAFEQMAQSKEPVVRIATDCTVLSWITTGDYNQTMLQADMLYYWGVTTKKRPYYQQ